MGGDGDHDAADRLSHFTRHFDQHRSPRANVALTQRIEAAAVVMVATTFLAGQCLDGQ